MKTRLADRRFTAATWNVYHGTPAVKVGQTVARLRERGVSLLLLQEVQSKEVDAAIRVAGYKLARPNLQQYAIAYDPAAWAALTEPRLISLSPTEYKTHGGRTIHVGAALLTLQHKRSGRRLTAMSYHLPPHVQVDPSNRPPRRIKALRQSMARMKQLAVNSENPCLFGGDDNVDERRAFAAFFRFMTNGRLRQTQAPHPTHAGGRKIDDFRSIRLRVGKGSVLSTPSDHKAHIRQFGFFS